MSLTSENMTPADIAAVTGNNGNAWNGEGGFFYLIVLFLLFFMGWGGNGINRAPVTPPVGSPTPYQTSTVTQNDIQNGFNHQSVLGHLDNIQQSVQNGFSGAEISRANQTTTFLQSMNQMGYNNLEQSNQIQRAIDDTKYTISTEGCADRNALSQAMQSLEISLNGKVQTVLDKINQQEIERKNDEINQLRTQLNMANLTASQTAQTGQLLGAQAVQTQNLVSQLGRPTPVPAYVVPNPWCNCDNSGTASGGGTRVTA